MTLEEATADVDALFGVTPWPEIEPELGEGTPIIPTGYRAIKDSTPNGDGTHSVWVAPVAGTYSIGVDPSAEYRTGGGGAGPGTIEDRVSRVIQDARGPGDPLDHLTPAECHAVYRAVQSGRVRIAEWQGFALQALTGSLIGSVYALPNGGYAGRTGGRIEEFGTEAEARAAVEGRAAEVGWTVVAPDRVRK
jgi:hypothetical protein